MMSNRVIFILLIVLFVLRLMTMHFSQLLPEEAYYWNYALHLDYGYLDHPPMIAFLIHGARKIIGDQEWAIRAPAVICYLGMAYFVFKWSECIQKGLGLLALLLISVLPFFFLQSMFMTPDCPLMFAWSAVLYYLYQAFVMEKKDAFYAASVALGLGLLSKYTILLLALSTLVYLCVSPNARSWWKRKELYCGGCVALLIFSPVIDWNATHHWASFVFQSSQRLQSNHQMTFHYFLLYLILFILPIGVRALIQLIQPCEAIKQPTKLFLQIYTLFPLAVFAFFSLIHKIKFNWIGPVFLAFIPCLALLIQQNKKQYLKQFYLSLKILMPTYAALMSLLLFAKPLNLYQSLFKKFIDWQDLSLKLNQIAQQFESTTGVQPHFLALDKYNIASELVFYQHKIQQQHKIKKIYPITGQHVLFNPSLMFQFWDKSLQHHGESVILVSWYPNDLNSTTLKPFMKFTSPVQAIFIPPPWHNDAMNVMYYQFAQLY